MTKNQMTATVFCRCLIKSKEDRLASFLFEMKQQQKTSVDISCLVLSL